MEERYRKIIFALLAPTYMSNEDENRILDFLFKNFTDSDIEEAILLGSVGLSEILADTAYMHVANLNINLDNDFNIDFDCENNKFFLIWDLEDVEVPQELSNYIDELNKKIKVKEWK